MTLQSSMRVALLSELGPHVDVEFNRRNLRIPHVLLDFLIQLEVVVQLIDDEMLLNYFEHSYNIPSLHA